jgi:hypothetical protein
MAGMSSRVMLLSIPSLGMHRVTGISSKLRSCIPFQPCHAQRAFNSGMCVAIFTTCCVCPIFFRVNRGPCFSFFRKLSVWLNLSKMDMKMKKVLMRPPSFSQPVSTITAARLGSPELGYLVDRLFTECPQFPLSGLISMYNTVYCRLRQ